MRPTLALAFCLVACPAAASGGLSCNADDQHVNIEIKSGVTRAMGGGLYSFGADLEIKDRSVPSGLRSTSFERDHVPQYWLDAKTLKLGFYRESDGGQSHAYVAMVIKTEADHNMEEYRGSYAIEVYDTADASNIEAELIEFTGMISCLVD